MMHNVFCPVSFGDCPDCEFWREYECQYYMIKKDKDKVKVNGVDE